MTRQIMHVTGRQNAPISIVVDVQRHKVWLALDSAFVGEAIMEPNQVRALIDMLGKANMEATSG